MSVLRNFKDKPDRRGRLSCYISTVFMVSNVQINTCVKHDLDVILGRLDEVRTWMGCLMENR